MLILFLIATAFVVACLIHMIVGMIWHSDYDPDDEDNWFYEGDES